MKEEDFEGSKERQPISPENPSGATIKEKEESFVTKEHGCARLPGGKRGKKLLRKKYAPRERKRSSQQRKS